jgi:hypothetical protein
MRRDGMRKLVCGIVIGLAVGAGATAFASTSGKNGKNYYLNRGDSAITADIVCTVIPRPGSVGGFGCAVGGDYRAKYGVIITDREASITQYTSFSRYHVIVRRFQSPIKP